MGRSPDPERRQDQPPEHNSAKSLRMATILDCPHSEGIRTKVASRIARATTKSSNVLKMRAILLSTQHFLPLLRNQYRQNGKRGETSIRGSTIRVYRYAPSPVLKSAGFNQLVRRLSPQDCSVPPTGRSRKYVSDSRTGDLTIILNSLTEYPCEHLAQTPLPLFTGKTVFLVALVTCAHRSKLHAFSADPAYTCFAKDGSSVTLLPQSSFRARKQKPSVLPETGFFVALGTCARRSELHAFSADTACTRFAKVCYR